MMGRSLQVQPGYTLFTAILSSAGIAVGFYGNGETSDGIHRATYSLRHANRTVSGVQDRVSGPHVWRAGHPLVHLSKALGTR